MKNKKHFLPLLLTIALTLLFVNGIILSAQEKDYASFTYNEWNDLSITEKYIYIIAYHQGIWAMAYQVEQQLGNTYLSKEMDALLPDCTNTELVDGIDWIYSYIELRNLPVYYILINFERTLQLRNGYYEQYEKGGM